MKDKRWERCKELLNIFRELYEGEVIGVDSGYLQLRPEYFKVLVIAYQLNVKSVNTKENIELSAELDGIKILTLI
jgi:hypothetical protein